MDFSNFLAEMNKKHEKYDKIVIQAVFLPNGRPLEIFFRFSSTRYGNFLPQSDFWQKLEVSVETMSRGMATVSTDYKMFRKGIFDLKVSSLAHNYREDYLKKVVHWLLDEFFPILVA